MAVYLTRIHIYKNEYHLEFYIIINSFLDLLQILEILKINKKNLKNMLMIYQSKLVHTK